MQYEYILIVYTHVQGLSAHISKINTKEALCTISQL